MIDSQRVRTSRRTVLVAGAGAAVGLLVACGRPSTPAGQPAPQATSAAATDVGRVVTLDGYVSLQALAELGVPIVATGTLGNDVRPFVDAAYRDVPSIGATATGELNLETIAAATPDLIIGRASIAGDDAAALAAISPTVLIDQDRPWREQYLTVADAVGRGEQARAAFPALDERLAALRTDIQAAWPNGVALSLVRVSDVSGEVRSYVSGDVAGWLLYSDVLRGAGITTTADRAPDLDPARVNISIAGENLTRIDGDVIIYYVGAGGQAGAGRDVEQALTGNPLFAQLDAVRAGRVHRVESGPWFDGYCIAAADAAVTDLRRVLLDQG